MEKSQTVAFTGYRPDKIAKSAPHNPNILWDIAAKLDAVIEDLYARGMRIFLTGMAEGFDIIAGEAVLRAKVAHGDIELVAVVPFPKQMAAFTDMYKIRHTILLAAADEVVYISHQYNAGVFHQRNDFLITHSSVVVTYFDNQPGGTAYTLRRANKQGLNVINLH